jgi:ribosome-binding factor A
MKSNDKKLKYEEQMLGELNILLRSSLSDPRLKLLSFTRVELSNDFSEAKVYWDTYNAGKRGQSKQAVEAACSKLRSLLASSLNVRHTPVLVMHYDSQFESEREIEGLLNSENKAGKSF